MTGVQIRAMGTTADFAPVMKRSIATLSDGRVVAVVIDTNLAGSGGTDTTGVAKIHVYVSTDATRTAFNLSASLTPAVAPASSTRAARASITIGSDNTVWIAWQGVDNGLYISRFNYSAGVFTFFATETIQAAGAITDRFRAIDIDIAGAANVMVGTYEAAASTGNGSFHRAYFRNVSGTWVRMFNLTAVASGQFIRANSEDIAVAWRGDGIVSNVGRFLIYGTKTSTTADGGDLIREYSYNASTSPADGAVFGGDWSFSYNANQAAGTRRAMIYAHTNSLYIFAGVVGAGVPKFFSIKLTTGNYSTPGTVNVAGYVSNVSLSNYFQIDPSVNNRTYWSTTYKDNQLIFSFTGIGTGSSPRILREVSMNWPDANAVSAYATVDLVPRPTDGAYYGNGGPIAVYGGDNHFVQAGNNTYNFLAMYGPSGNGVSTSPGAQRVMRFVSEDIFDAPFLIAPSSVEPTNRPTYRVRVDNNNLEPNLYGRIEIAAATDTGFTTNVKSIVQGTDQLQYFGSVDGVSGGSTQVSVDTPGAGQALFQGTWYWRSRVISDKGKAGPWSGTYTFTVSHPPQANPVYPSPASVVPKIVSNNYTFTWTRSDTEPNDSQTAYRLLIRRLDTMATVVDTGFFSSSATTSTQNIDVAGLGLLEVPLDWSVQLKDADGVAGPLSTPVQFTIGVSPTLAIVTPANGSTVTTALPTVTWTFTGFGQRIQRAYRISIYDTSGVLGPDPVVTTGWRVGIVTSYSFTSQVLINSNPYQVVVEVQDSGGLISTATSNVTTGWSAPPQASGTVVTTPDEFKVHIAWTSANRDLDFVSYRVYRRYMKTAIAAFDLDNTATTWFLMYETDAILTNYAFDDYLAPLNKQVEYVVVQVADRFGSLIESTITTTSPVTLAGDRYFFVPEVNLNGIASFEASGVTGDNFTSEIEQETIHVKGRGRQVQIGDDLGVTGTFTIQLRNPATARRDREFFQIISSQYNKVYMKNPFGDVVLLALGNVSADRQAGYGGYADFADLSIPYMQIIDSSVIVRRV